MIWAVFITSAFGLNWILDSGSYFSIKDLSNTLALGIMWGTEYKLNHEMTDHNVYLSVPYADPGNFYIQKAYDKSLSLELTQTWEISEDSWKMSFEGLHKPDSPIGKQEKLVNVIVFGAVLEGFLEYNQKKWTGSFDFNVESSAELLIKTVKTSDVFEKVWKIKKFVQKWLHDSSVSQNNKYGVISQTTEAKSNLFFIQIQARSPFNIKLVYNSYKKDLSSMFLSYDNKYLTSFGLPLFKDFEYSVLGYFNSGLGYFQGKIQVSTPAGVQYSQENSLLSFVPSRVTFPRGFLWDEGFHLLVSFSWNKGLCYSILSSWLRTMDENGWIPREQIRGQSAETRVPSAFIPQSPEIANPPSFVFVIENMIEDLSLIAPEDLLENEQYKTLKNNYRLIKKWYFWLLNSQVNSEGFPMWKGRTADHNLASGLDDYPRGLQVSLKERHLDLYMWLITFTKTLIKLSNLFSEFEDSLLFSEKLTKLNSFSNAFTENQEMKDYSGDQFVVNTGEQAYYWTGDHKCKIVNNPLGLPAECNPYSDYPCCSEFGWCGNSPNHCWCQKCKRATPLEERENLKKKPLFSPHIGYVSLMPFIVGFVEIESVVFHKILEYVYSPNILWSQYGLRSLSKSDLLFKTGENYWRGEIWMNFNYLVLRAMKKYYWKSEKVKKIYAELRENIIHTVYNSWKDTGYIWEQYSESNGQGLRVHPFSGWSALILNIVHEKY